MFRGKSPHPSGRSVLRGTVLRGSSVRLSQKGARSATRAHDSKLQRQLRQCKKERLIAIRDGLRPTAMTVSRQATQAAGINQ